MEEEQNQSKSGITEDLLRYDSDNFMKLLDKFPEDVRVAYSVQVRNALLSIKRYPDMRVILCGMGGSGIAGELMKTYLHKENLRLETVADYTIPGELKKTDLVILTSYSGNTEEVQSCYRQARGAGTQLVIITSGGKLEEICSTGRVPLVKIPKGYPPRAALAYLFFSLLRVFEETGLIQPRTQEVQALVDYLLKNSLKDYAMSLSTKLYGKIPLIYSSKTFYPVAYRWKTQINENAKATAFSAALPELDHNEILSFENKNGMYHIVFISTDEDSARMRKRMTVTKELIQQSGIDVTELNIKGNLLIKIFSAITVGDLTSYYLSLRYHTNPYPVNLIEDLKKKMGPFI